MPRKFLFIFTLSILVASTWLNGQELLRTVLAVDYTITAKKSQSESPARQMLASLAMNNGINLYQLKIDWRANIFISIRNDENGSQSMNLKILNQQISGNTFFRNFSIDSLLFPASLNGMMNLYLPSGKSFHLPLKLLTSGETTVIQFADKLVINPDSVVIMLDIEHAVFSQESEMAFRQATTQINLYFAYNEILKELIAAPGSRLTDKNHETADVFIDWHHISRLNAYIVQHDFSTKLHLEKNDPTGFLKRCSAAQRMEKRAATLFRQSLKGRNEKTPADREKYCRAYAQLSQTYLHRATRLQPYLAGGFEEMAKICPTKQEKTGLTEAAAFYDAGSRLKDVSTPQLVYTQFVYLAAEAFNKNQFVAALQMLQNAAQIDEWFETVFVSDNWSKLYSQSLDGVMSSYLQVAVIAYKSGKRDMADKYYQNALLVFEQFGSPFSASKVNPLSFLNFTHLQVELSTNLLADGQWLKALSLLNQAAEIRNCLPEDSLCNEIFLLASRAHRGIFDRKMNMVDSWIDLEEYDKAAIALDSTRKYTEYFSNFFSAYPTGEFEKRAVLIFRAFYSRGKTLLNSKHPDKALSSFLKAREMEKKYLPTRDSLLQNLVYNATTPVIIAIIDSARFETWVNRLDRADSLYREARKMQVNYRQEDNTALNAAFLALEEKMEQRECVSTNYRLINLGELAENAVRAGEFEEAEAILQKAGALISSDENCKPDSAKTVFLKNKYNGIFEYLHRLKQIEIYIDKPRYDTVIVLFVSLKAFYAQQKLESFGVDEPSLDKYVAEKGIPDLSRAASLYYVRAKDFMRALYFLNLLKEQQVPAWGTREIQLMVGKGIGKMEIDAEMEKQVLQFTAGDNWYIFFKVARLSAKVLK